MRLMQSCFLLDTQEGLYLTDSFGIESTLFFQFNLYGFYNYKYPFDSALKHISFELHSRVRNEHLIDNFIDFFQFL